MRVAILKYNAGNVLSVANALKRLGVEALVTDDPLTLQQADKVIFPGVGEAAGAMNYLRARGLDSLLRALTQPLLGICLGLQLLCTHSEEGDTPALDCIPTRVRRLRCDLKVPHMGWNSLQELRAPLFTGLPPQPELYFVHSFCAELSDYSAAQTTYGETFSSALWRDNFHAVQFHPEKSGLIGERILKNFLEL